MARRHVRFNAPECEIMTGSKTALLLLPFVLAACDSQPRRILHKTGNGATVPSSILRPGQWQVRATDDPIYAPAMANIPDRTGMTPRVREFCLRPDAAAAPGPDALLGQGGSNTCKPDVWHVDHGNISGVLLYPETHGAPMRFSGSYSAETYEIDMEIRFLGTSFTRHLDARRIGDCSR